MARRAFTGITGSSLINTFPATLTAFQGELDRTVFYDQGPLSSRPVATPGSPSLQVGDLYLVTDGPVPLLYRNAGTKWVPLTMPTFSAAPAADSYTIAANLTPTKIKFDSEEWDDAGAFNPATSRFTPNIPGVYRVSAHVGLQDPIDSGKQFSLALYKNGVSYRQLDLRIHGAATAVDSVGGTTMVAANGTSDYFEIFALVENSVARRYWGSWTWFQGELVRPA